MRYGTFTIKLTDTDLNNLFLMRSEVPPDTTSTGIRLELNYFERWLSSSYKNYSVFEIGEYAVGMLVFGKENWHITENISINTRTSSFNNMYLLVDRPPEDDRIIEVDNLLPVDINDYDFVLKLKDEKDFYVLLFKGKKGPKRDRSVLKNCFKENTGEDLFTRMDNIAVCGYRNGFDVSIAPFSHWIYDYLRDKKGVLFDARKIKNRKVLEE